MSSDILCTFECETKCIEVITAVDELQQSIREIITSFEVSELKVA